MALTTVDQAGTSRPTSISRRTGQAEVRMGLSVELYDTSGKLLEKSKIDFLSPQVDPHAAGHSGEGAGALRPRNHAQCAADQGPGYLEHEADGGGSGAGGDAAGRADVSCLLRANRQIGQFIAAQSPVDSGRHGRECLFHHVGSECRRPGGGVEHAIPCERDAGFLRFRA